MKLRPYVTAAATALVAAGPLAALAAPEYYTPPTLVKHGAPSSAVPGAGTVVVQVLVNADGTFKVSRVVRSTNHADDAAALEVAKTSTYKPATRGSKAVTAYYDYTLKFTAGGGAAQSSDTGGTGGDVAKYARMIRAANYAGAKAGLATYIAAHPDDAQAQTQLAVADTFLGDYDGAADAFSKAPVSSEYAPAAAKAYAEAASAALRAKDYARATTYAQKAVAVAPSVSNYNSLGLAQLNTGDAAGAVTSLEKARSLGASDAKETPHDRALIDGNLVSAYLAAGQVDKAKTVAAEATKTDPSETTSANVFANYYIKEAQTAAAADKGDAAAAAYEQAAAMAPSSAADLYGEAAIAYLNLKPANNAKASVDAQKALALKPDSAVANYAAGVALANTPGKDKDALVYLQKADASAKAGTDPKLTAAIEKVIKQLGTPK